MKTKLLIILYLLVFSYTTYSQTIERKIIKIEFSKTPNKMVLNAFSQTKRIFALNGISITIDPNVKTDYVLHIKLIDCECLDNIIYDEYGNLYSCSSGVSYGDIIEICLFAEQFDALFIHEITHYLELDHLDDDSYMNFAPQNPIKLSTELIEQLRNCQFSNFRKND